MQHGKSLYLSGTAQGLQGHELWVLAHPDEGNGYYLIKEGPVAVADGPWNYDDPEVGDESDIGHQVTYLAYAADSTCAGWLRDTEPDEDDELVRKTMDPSCGENLATKQVSVT